jgi:hypothetical protein
MTTHKRILLEPTEAGYAVLLDDLRIGNINHTLEGKPVVGGFITMPWSIHAKTLQFATIGLALDYLLHTYEQK